MTKFFQNHDNISISSNRKKFIQISTNSTSFSTLVCVLARDLEGEKHSAEMHEV
jgi:hypothetical protein